MDWLQKNLTRFPMLMDVNLSGIRSVPPTSLLALSKTLGERDLKTVDLSDMGMTGRISTTMIENLLENDFLEELNISWNTLDPEGF